ncbi:MAG: universal stress protein [Desulfobacterales bacterium]|nr:universal stress protein [Desulfobacterales bacterium]
MKRFKNILYVMEENADQTSALARAASIAEKNQAKLTVIDVIRPLMGDYLKEIIQMHNEFITSLIKPFSERLEIQHKVKIGTAFLEVIREVLRNEYDLVMKPAENPDFLKRLFGSTDIHLLRKCPCPVWIMKLPEKTNYSCIVAAVGFTPLEISEVEDSLNREILDLATSMALSDFASLHVLHAWETFAGKYIRSRTDKTHENMAVYVEKERSLHQAGLNIMVEKLSDRIGRDVYEKLSMNLHLPQGDAQKIIPESSVSLQADLVVMGTIARTGIPGLIIGNTAESVLDQLECSVLAVKPPGFVTPVKLS